MQLIVVMFKNVIGKLPPLIFKYKCIHLHYFGYLIINQAF